EEAWELYHDLLVLRDIEAHGVEKGDLDPAWTGQLLSELNRFANEFDLNHRETWQPAAQILKALYQNHNGTHVHELSAIGHAHIDTAWLWPLAESWRKCERTFSSQTTYMDEYPEYRFACSQAVQYEVMKERNPDLYARIKERVERGQFIPVGGTWIEPDCNIPSGEALARQFLFGQRYFQKEFGITCREFWNPDVFGYNGQLPQIMKQSGITRFLTQKLSWNRFNKPMHHTFMWQGIDGSEVLAHFPPADTYNASAEVWELRTNARAYKDHDRSQNSLMLFGYGDGGGGPTKRMLEILRRAKDLQGLPRTQPRTSDEFFEILENDLTDRPSMVGELYFEYHRGTYTSQAKTKLGNRKGEFLLHDIEFLSVLAAKQGGLEYPRTELERLWKLLLLNQFHDILPGSSIAEVYVDAERDYDDIQNSGVLLRDAALSALGTKSGEARSVAEVASSEINNPDFKMAKSADDLENLAQPAAIESAFTPFNTVGFERSEVVETPNGQLVYAHAPAYGIGQVLQNPEAVRVEKDGDNFVLENAHLRAVLNPGGDVVSLVEKASGREAIDGAANVFEIYEDWPTNFDAWDVDPYHLETRKVCAPATSATISRSDALRGEISFERKVGEASEVRQTVRLDADARRLEFVTEIEWHESH
ncbi:MAG TPA: glycoside hydrolase family 38 C-terminal domain-containing protein, partial [Abditibacteriaceae bacterium]